MAQLGQNLLLQDLGLHGHSAFYWTTDRAGNTRDLGSDLLFP